jgi:hypothetical protein
MNEAVQFAVDQINTAFPQNACEAQDDGDGGAWVIVEGVPLGEIYTEEASWVGFRITFQYPNADVYPHFVRGDLLRKDGRSLGEGVQVSQTFLGRPALQLSRRSSRWNPKTDNALIKLQKVMQWFTTHP